MFESAELGHKIDKATYDKQAPRLRADLLDAQYDMGELKKYSVIILVNGVNGAGKGETVNLLNAWMDPRHIQTHAFPPPTDEERERPFMWRFWRALPPKGKIGILFGNWYTEPIVNRARKQTKAADLDQSIEEINRFEKMLTNEGALHHQVLDASFQAGAEKAPEGAGEEQENPLARDADGLGAFRHVRQVPRRFGARAAPYQHGVRAMDRCRGR